MILFLSSSRMKMFFRQMVVIPTFGSSVNFIFVLFQLHGNKGVKVDIISYHGVKVKLVFHSLITVISYLPRSNVLWCPTLVLLSQTCFLLLLPGSYGYDSNCCFQAKMIIIIRNELPSSCLRTIKCYY